MRKSQNRTYLTFAINFYILVFGFQMTMMGPLLEKMASSFGLNVAQAGSLFSFSAAGFATAIIAAGILSDRIGKQKVVIWSAFGFAAALLLYAWSPWFSLSVILFFMAGGFGGILESTLSAVVADINPGREGRAVSLTHVFFGLGAIMGPAFGGWLADSSYPWQSAYFLAGGLALGSALWLFCYAFPGLKEDERMELHVLKAILSNRRFVLLCTAVALYVGAETSVWGWAPKYLSSELDYTSAEAGRMVGILWAAITFGRLATAWLTQKKSGRFLVNLLCLTAAVGLVAVAVPSLAPAVMVSFLLIGLGFSGIWPVVVSQAGTIFASKYTGTSFGLAVAAGGIGGMVVPYLFGWIAETARMGFLLGLLSVFMLSIITIYAAVIRMGADADVKKENKQVAAS